jgi:hypothetical protein
MAGWADLQGCGEPAEELQERFREPPVDLYSIRALGVAAAALAAVAAAAAAPSSKHSEAAEADLRKRRGRRPPAAWPAHQHAEAALLCLASHLHMLRGRSLG